MSRRSVIVEVYAGRLCIFYQEDLSANILLQCGLGEGKKKAQVSHLARAETTEMKCIATVHRRHDALMFQHQTSKRPTLPLLNSISSATAVFTSYLKPQPSLNALNAPCPASESSGLYPTSKKSLTQACSITKSTSYALASTSHPTSTYMDGAFPGPSDMQ